MPPRGAASEHLLAVRGLRDLQKALALSSKEAQEELKQEFQTIAEPIRLEAQSLARARIPRVGEDWSQMRTGVTLTRVYVAPKERGARGKGNDRYKRREFADLLMGRAMEPALERHSDQVVRKVDRVLDRMADGFNHGGGAVSTASPGLFGARGGGIAG